MNIDGLSYTIGCFFACSMGVFTGALLANWLVGLGRRRGHELASAEY